MFRNRFDILAETRNGLEELFDQPGSEYSRNRFQAGVPLPVCKPVIIHTMSIIKMCRINR